MRSPLLRRQRTQSAAPDLDDVARLHAEIEAARTDIVRIEAARIDVVLDGSEDDVIALDADLGRARVRFDQATAQHGRAVQARVAAVAAEDDARRRALYERGRAAFRLGRDLYQRAYPEAAREVAAVLQRIAEQEAIVDTANRNLPAGVAEIEQVEPSNGFVGHGVYVPPSPIRPRVSLPGIGTHAVPFWPASTTGGAS